VGSGGQGQPVSRPPKAAGVGPRYQIAPFCRAMRWNPTPPHSPNSASFNPTSPPRAPRRLGRLDRVERNTSLRGMPVGVGRSARAPRRLDSKQHDHDVHRTPTAGRPVAPPRSPQDPDLGHRALMLNPQASLIVCSLRFAIRRRWLPATRTSPSRDVDFWHSFPRPDLRGRYAP